MFQVKPMNPNDYLFATELANTMNWNMATQDFEFMASLEPEGSFVAYDGAERIGIATSISYGKVGWFGNLIVKQEYRKKGVGSLLVKHAVECLQNRGVQTIGLYAYPSLLRFYGDLGFKFDMDFSLLHAEKVSLSCAKALPKVDESYLGAIEDLDCRCFGGDRKKLLETIILDRDNLSFYVSDGKEAVGYVAATVYESMAWVGPLMCQQGNFDAAVSLAKAVLAKLAGKNVYAVLPKQPSPLFDVFATTGFREEFFVSRMFLGEATAKNCIYIAESLERG